MGEVVQVRTVRKNVRRWKFERQAAEQGFARIAGVEQRSITFPILLHFALSVVPECSLNSR